MGNEQQDHYLALLASLVAKTRENLDAIEATVARLAGERGIDPAALLTTRDASESSSVTGETLEGIFNGFEFVGGDGRTFGVPANYASKSKLVEGDLLKLTIKHDGALMYKQIGPVERERVRGIIARDPETNAFAAVVGEHAYKVLTASVTYHHGDAGDEVVLLIPKGGRVHWAAVETVIKK